jgi:addiction module RelE/StbE family toxin
MKALFEDTFLKALQRHASIKKAVKKKVDMILQNPITVGEPLKGNWQGFYSCPVKRNFIIIYLFCEICRKKGDQIVVDCADCKQRDDQTIKFILLGPHDKTYGI